jgi:hypothetical protein
LFQKPIIASLAITEAPFEIMIDSSRSIDFWTLEGEAYILAKETRKDGAFMMSDQSGPERRVGEMLKHLLSTAACIAGLFAFLVPGSAQAQIKATYDEIVAAAKKEPPVQWCTGMTPKETNPLVAGRSPSQQF